MSKTITVTEKNITPVLQEVAQVPWVTKPKLDANVSVRWITWWDIWALFAIWQLTLDSTWDTTVDIWFKPKLIRFSTYASRSAWSDVYSWSQFSWSCDIDLNNKCTWFWNMSNDTSLWNAYRTSSSSSKCVYAWTYDTDNHYSYWNITEITDTWFIINVWQKSDTMNVLWEAVW